MITQQGALNTTALVVPDLYVQLVPPSTVMLNGVPTNVLGIVGSTSWGPVGMPVIIGTASDYAAAFGPVVDRLYDMGTHVAIAIQQGANNLCCVRVTDGTDTAATISDSTGSITFTARYSGSLGNRVSVTLSAGSQADSWAATIGIPGLPLERFDNITGSGAAFWTALALAINTGVGQLSARASRFVTAEAKGGATKPTSASYTLAGGTDGAASVTSASLVGSMSPRRGMYALIGQSCSLIDLCDCTDPTHWSTIDAFASSEGAYAILSGPAGDTIANAVSIKAEAGVDSYAVKLLFGDWLYWWDATNQTQRLVSPQPFAAGRLVNLSPEQSGLNKQLFGIIGSQGVGLPGSNMTKAYSSAELSVLFENGIDLITRPGAGGQNFWTMRLGHNSSSNPATSGDTYTRLTNYIAATLNAGMGAYVGSVINSALLRNIKGTLLGFLSNLLSQGILGNIAGTQPFAVLCDAVNNPPARTALGYVQADVQVQYQGINEKFLVNLDAGATVLVTTSSGAAGTSGSGSGSGSTGGGTGGGSAGAGSGSSGSTASGATLSFQLAPSGPYTTGEANIGVNAVLAPGSTTASIQFGWSNSATKPPTIWTAGVYVNSQSNGDALYGTYLTAPASTGTYYGWVATTDGAVSAVSGAATVA